MAERTDAIDAAYKETLNELVEKLEPILNRAKELKAISSKDEYIRLLEEQNRVLKEHYNLTTVKDPDSDSFSSFSNSSSIFSWNSVIVFFFMLWLFLMFLGF
jgi:hypothetical protein